MATPRPWVVLLNLAIPGAGLIVCRRAWLGFSLSLLFGICANLFVAGWIIAPAAIPAWLTAIAGGLSLVSWIAAQALYSRQAIYERRLSEELRALIRASRGALDAGNVAEARKALERLGSIELESPECHVLWARLWSLEGNEPQAQAQWRYVLSLESAREYHVEAQAALGRRVQESAGASRSDHA